MVAPCASCRAACTAATYAAGIGREGRAAAGTGREGVAEDVAHDTQRALISHAAAHVPSDARATWQK